MPRGSLRGRRRSLPGPRRRARGAVHAGRPSRLTAGGATIFDAKLVYWTAAFLNFAGVVGFAVAGVRRIRSGDVEGHRRMMLCSAALVALFLVSYVLKVLAMGREDRSAWSDSALWILYAHETCIAVMLAAAGVALTRARRFGPLRAGATLVPEARAGDRRLHRVAGRTAVVASLLALVGAGVVLATMFARSGS